MISNTKIFHNITKILLVAVLFSISSCNLSEREVKLNELALKNAELDYLDRLYKIKQDIELKEQIRVLDSLINAAE
jgi:hypothetical protein